MKRLFYRVCTLSKWLQMASVTEVRRLSFREAQASAREVSSSDRSIDPNLSRSDSGAHRRASDEGVDGALCSADRERSGQYNRAYVVTKIASHHAANIVLAMCRHQSNAVKRTLQCFSARCGLLYRLGNRKAPSSKMNGVRKGCAGRVHHFDLKTL